MKNKNISNAIEILPKAFSRILVKNCPIHINRGNNCARKIRIVVQIQTKGGARPPEFSRQTAEAAKPKRKVASKSKFPKSNQQERLTTNTDVDFMFYAS